MVSNYMRGEKSSSKKDTLPMITTQVSYTKNRPQHDYWRQFKFINLQTDNMTVSVFRSNKDMMDSNNQLLASLLFGYPQNCGWNLKTEKVCVL